MILRSFRRVVLFSCCVVGAAAAASGSRPLSADVLGRDDGHPRLLPEAAVGEVPDGVKESVEKDLGFSTGDETGSSSNNSSSGGGGGDGEDDDDDACSDGSVACIKSFDLAKMKATPLKTEPFKYLVVEQMVPPARLKRILQDFPPALLSTALANKKNVEERDVRATGQVKGAYAKLIEDAKSPAFRAAVGAKVGMDLSKAFTRVTLRGACQPKPCGGVKSIHVDHVEKVVSILMYLNEDWPAGEEGAGGHLLLLKKPPKKGLDALGDGNVYDEVKSYGGNMVVFVNDRSPKANWVWHGLRHYVGLRRAIQINYCKTKTCN